MPGLQQAQRRRKNLPLPSIQREVQQLRLLWASGLLKGKTEQARLGPLTWVSGKDRPEIASLGNVNAVLLLE